RALRRCAGLLGRHIPLPRRGAPRPDDQSSGRDRPRQFTGRTPRLNRTDYSTHLEMDMNASMKTALALAAISFSSLAAAQITFYEREDFEGRSFTTAQRIGNLERFAFNDRASSAVVRGSRWEICEHAGFEGRCMVLRPGSY